MQSLAPFEPGEAGPQGASATRVPWFIVGVTIGVALVGFLLMSWREVIDLLRRHTVLQAELAVCGGTLAGLVLSRMEMGPLMRKRLALLDGYTHYLPCVILMADEPTANLTAAIQGRSEAAVVKAAASGVLYVGPKGALLCTITSDNGTRPHRAQASRVWLPWPRAGKPESVMQTSLLDLGPVRQVTAVSLAMPQGHIARLARIRPRYAMLLRWPTGQALMAIPAIGDTLPKLHRCFDELRWCTQRPAPST
jgi:hypothetical protein